MATLDRAVALAERDDGARGVGEELDLDVARPLDVALAEHAIVPEGGRRLPLRGRERLFELPGSTDDSHPATPAARGGLDDERVADLIRLSVRHDGHAGLAGDLLRGELVAALPQGVGRRPHEGDPGGLDRLRELGALGEEAVSGMDGVGSPPRGGLHDRAGVEVALDLEHAVGRARVERLAIVGRRDGDRLDTEPAARAEDPHGDLAPVRDEQPLHALLTIASVARQQPASRR